jgi:signal transduction histidine kinase
MESEITPMELDGLWLGLFIVAAWATNLLFLHLSLGQLFVLGIVLFYVFAVVLSFLALIYSVLAFIFSLFASYIFNFTMFTLLLVTQYLAPIQLDQAVRPLYLLGLLVMFLGLGSFEAWWEHRSNERDRRIFEQWEAQERERRKRESEARRERRKQQGGEPYQRHGSEWCYWVLGIPITATLQEIKAAYRRMALRYHPDVNKSRDAEARMKEINEAYERLSKEQGRTINT